MLICHDRVNGSGCGAKNMDNAKHCQQCGMSLRYALVLINDGVIVGSYQISYVIGYGGFGAVYAAEDTRTRQEVALKETFDTNSTRAFQSEFNVLHRLSQDHLPHYYEMFEEQGNGYLVMELIPGQSLLEVLQRRQRQPLVEEQVLGYTIQVCGVLTYLHQQIPSLIHRDIKPANIRLTPEGLIKLVDFGLLKQGIDKTGSSRMGLTPAYAPLEQWSGTGMHTTPQSDIYSLGATLYHLLTGQPPFTVTDRLAATTDPLLPPCQINPRLSEHVSDAIMKAMEIHPSNRFQDVAAFRLALINSYATKPTQVAPVVQPNVAVYTPQQAILSTTVSEPTQRLVTTPLVRSRLPKWAILVASMMVIVLLMVGTLVISMGGIEQGNSTREDSNPTTINIVAIMPTNTPTPTIQASLTPTITPTTEVTLTSTFLSKTNELFPVTLDEWRNEQATLSTDFTREGEHYWRFVPGKTYTIGYYEKVTETLPNYWIAKFPVTKQQYHQFIDAGGYDNQDYWTPNGWEWKEQVGRTQPWHWNEEWLSNDAQPLVVTWYEATAYASWLNKELGDSLPNGYRIRLPTEAEWEVACAYGEDDIQHTYPWGEQQLTRALADFDDGAKSNRPVSVGEHPLGTAACGAQNMVGTVWEAMSNSYTIYPTDTTIVIEDLAQDEADVPWRGGAWYDTETLYIRCTARGSNYPHGNSDGNDDGFRLVLSQ